MRKLLFLVCFQLLLPYNIKAQVGIGIGENIPVAELEIGTENTGSPALNLRPQPNPSGEELGQLAIIDDRVYAYDPTREKWLSIETEAMAYNEDSASDGQPSRFGGDLTSGDSGPVMPFNGTVVYATGRVGASNSNKPIEIRIKSGASILNSETVNFSEGQFVRNDLNLDFNAGNYLEVFITGEGDAIQHHAILLWVKWRK